MFAVFAPRQPRLFLELGIATATLRHSWQITRRRNALGDSRIDDDGVEPLADRQAMTSRRLARGLARLRPDPFHTPRIAGFHGRIRVDWRAAVAGRFFGNRHFVKTRRTTALESRFFPFAVNEALRATRSLFRPPQVKTA